MRFTIIALVAVALQGCGGGSSSTEIIAMDSSDTVQAKLIEGKTITAKSSLMSAIVFDADTGEISNAAAGTFATRLPSGADEDITMIVNGKEVTFTASDRWLSADGVTYYGWTQNDGDTRYSLWTWANGGAINSISPSGESFVNVWEFFENDDATYSVTGIETAGGALTSLGTASYRGYSDIKAYPNGTYGGFETVNRLESNDTVLQADFANGTISGAMGDLRWGWSGDSDTRVPVDGEIIMEAAAISGDGSYSGTLSPDAAFASNGVVSTDGGTYSGDFFGPEADATAGPVSMTFSSDGTDFVGTGFFNTQKENNE